NAIVINGVSKVFKKPQPLFHFPGKSRAHHTQTQQKDVQAVDNVSMVIKRGEIVGLLGANGSGKSTLIRMLSTLLIPDTGNISIFGHDVVREELRAQSLVNRVSVEASFFKTLSPMENLMYAARLYNMSGSKARTSIVDILTRLGIKPDRIQDPLQD